MKEVGRVALRFLFIMALGDILTMVFAAAVLGDFQWLAILMTVLLLLAIFYVGFLEGASVGRKDRMYQATMEKQEEERGVQPTKEEKSRFFHAQKGFAGAFLAASPGILLSLLMLFLPRGGELYATLTPILRLFLGMYLGLYAYIEGLMPYIYLPLALIMPLLMGFSYCYGPKLYDKMMKQLEENKRKRRRRRRKKAQPKA